MSSQHAAIEQINRLFTGVVAIVVILAVLWSFRIQPRRRELVLLSLGLVAGVLLQILIGGLVVMTGLNPYSNMAHFLVSLVLITNAQTLLNRTRGWTVAAMFKSTSKIVNVLARSILGLTGLAVVTGTAVTGSGPHAGDEHAVRLNLILTSVVRFHGVAVLSCLMVSTILLLVLKQRGELHTRFAFKLERFIGVGVVQGVVGYTQYFLGIPVTLVAIHVGLAVLVWLCAVDLIWVNELDKSSANVVD